ncbi:MAG: hypothetical protein HZC23_08235 [Rhodocyclales bacterium]|nr:hypothetical protein [Rhodocyclales bacterium]
MHILGIFAFLLASSVCLADPGPGFTIHSINGPSNGSDEISIVIEYSYDGSHGDTVGAGARVVSGSNLEMQSYGFRPALLVKGERQVQRFVLSRPQRENSFRTDAVEVFSYVGGSFYFARKIVDYSIDWVAVPSLSSYENYGLEGFAIAYDVGDYAEAERVFDLWSKIDAVDVNGDQMLKHYMNSLMSRFKHDREGSIAKIRAWRSVRPNSIAAMLTEAWFWIAYAEHLHGRKAPDADTMSVIRQYQTKASIILNKTRPLTGRHPLWQIFQLKMAINAGLREKEVMRAFENAVLDQPKYPYLYIEAVQYLAKSDVPGRWRGINEIADRLDKAVSAINAGAYADLLDHAADSASNTVLDPFTTGYVSWPRTRDSWKALIQRYPSAYNLNRFASRACQAHDKDAFETALGKIGKRVSQGAWPPNLSLDLCRRRFLKES